MEIDVGRMFQYPKCAVHCDTKEDGRALVEEVSRSVNVDIDSWRGAIFKDDYSYTMFGGGHDIPDLLRRACGKRFYMNHGFEIVEFSDLVVQMEINDSDCDISSLFCLEASK